MILNNVTLLINGKLVLKDVYFEDKVLFIKDKLSKGVDCTGLFLMPGLRNAHVHLASRLVAGSAIGLSKYDYFDNIGFKVHDKRRDIDVYNASLLACLESLKCGVTHVDTMDTNPKQVIKALKKTGLSYSSCLAIKDSHLEAGDVKEQFDRTLNLKGNVLVGLANEFECSPQLLRDGLAFAKSNDLPIHMHACETIEEVKYFKKLTGKRTIQYLSDIGMLDFDVRLAHCTFADSKDVLLLSEHDVPVLHCPTSNKAISGVVPPVKDFLRNGVRVWVGTDSFAWNPNASVLSECLRSVELTGVSVLQAYSMAVMPFEEGVSASFSLVDMSALKPFKSVDEFILKLMYLLPIKSVYLNGREVVVNGEVVGFNFNRLFSKVNKIGRRLLN